MKEEENRQVLRAVEEAGRFESLAEVRSLTEEEKILWKQQRHIIRKQEWERLNDLHQRAKIEWVINGDENSSFFHGVINCRRARNKINGLILDNSWVEDPIIIKQKVLQSFKSKFEEPMVNRPQLDGEGFKRLRRCDSELLTARFSKEEIKEAVWECGDDKSPGPDGFTFAFVKKFWGKLDKYLIEVMEQFYVHGSIHSSCNSSFIALLPKVADPLTIGDFRPVSLIGVIGKVISKVLANRLKKVLDKIISPEQSAFITGRNILDGPLIANEVVSWAKKSKNKVLFFKADFAKAFDCLSWKFLINVMHHMGFPSRWKNWVMGILFTGKASILINGAPTTEFLIRRGLRQGDPLSPFLFTIAMEAVHVMMAKAVSAGTFRGVNLPNNGPTLSHLLYADDALFIGEWSETNALNLNRILRCFYLVSGLKVNLQKSKLYGIEVGGDEVSSMARKLNCLGGELPFIHLGLLVGANMNRSGYWKVVVDKFNTKLTSWKARNLSFAGRTTLIKAVLGSLPNYYLSLYKAPAGIIKTLEGIRRRFLWGGTAPNNKKIRWIAWKKILKPKNFGGLGVGSIGNLNLALITKWWWRYKVSKEQLWAKVIGALHGGVRTYQFIPCKNVSGVWKSIAAAGRELAKRNINIEDMLVCEVGVGNSVQFWNENWVAGGRLRDRFPMAYGISRDKKVMVADCYKRAGEVVFWDWAWKRMPSSELEIQEVKGLMDILMQEKTPKRPDQWMWRSIGGVKYEFSVKMVRENIAEVGEMPDQGSCFKWNSMATPKVNCFVWRAMNRRIPTADALARRGVHIGDSTCPRCGIGAETVDHIFASCAAARSIWGQICIWLKLQVPTQFDSIEQALNFSLEAEGNKKKKKVIHAIFLLVIWTMWMARNDKLFNGRNISQTKIIQDIKEVSLWWVLKRAKVHGVDAEKWHSFSGLISFV